jgi:hypothetical protein
MGTITIPTTVTAKGLTCVANGWVIGRMWGGGVGGYPSTPVTGKTVEEVIDTATSMLDGSLDSGMGFESLIGAVLDITVTTTILVNGEEYQRSIVKRRYIGTLTQSQKNYLAKWRNAQIQST